MAEDEGWALRIHGDGAEFELAAGAWIRGTWLRDAMLELLPVDDWRESLMVTVVAAADADAADGSADDGDGRPVRRRRGLAAVVGYTSDMRVLLFDGCADALPPLVAYVLALQLRFPVSRVVGPPGIVDRFASLFCEQTGHRRRAIRSYSVPALDLRATPPPASSAPAVVAVEASAAHVELLARWLAAFTAELRAGAPLPAARATNADLFSASLAVAERRAWLLLALPAEAPRPLAMAMVRADGVSASVTALYTPPEARRAGSAKALLRLVAEHFRGRLERMCLEADDAVLEREPVAALMRSCGFVASHALDLVQLSKPVALPKRPPPRGVALPMLAAAAATRKPAGPLLPRKMTEPDVRRPQVPPRIAQAAADVDSAPPSTEPAPVSVADSPARGPPTRPTRPSAPPPVAAKSAPPLDDARPADVSEPPPTSPRARPQPQPPPATDEPMKTADGDAPMAEEAPAAGARPARPPPRLPAKVQMAPYPGRRPQVLEMVEKRSVDRHISGDKRRFSRILANIVSVQAQGGGGGGGGGTVGLVRNPYAAAEEADLDGDLDGGEADGARLQCAQRDRALVRGRRLPTVQGNGRPMPAAAMAMAKPRVLRPVAPVAVSSAIVDFGGPSAAGAPASAAAEPAWMTGDGARPSFAISDTVTIHSENYTVYVVDVVQDDGTRRQLSRRYREFRELHQRLQRRYPRVALPAFPPKKMFNKLAAETVDQRRADLERYLNALYDAGGRALFQNPDAEAFFGACVCK